MAHIGGVHAWDLDNTIRPGSLLTEALVHCAEQGWTERTVADPAYPTRDDIEHFVSLLPGRSLHDFRLLTERLADCAHQDSFPWALDTLREQHRRGEHIAILSHSPAFLVRAFAAGLGLTHHASGSYFHTKDHIFSGRAVQLDKVGQLRRYSLRRQLREPLGNVALSFAAGDSMSDVPLLVRAERAVVVNPGAELAALATTHGWEIVTTRHPSAIQ